MFMAVSTGAWWSWTTWTYIRSLEARLETHLAALEAGLEVNKRIKGVTSEPSPDGQDVLPKTLPMRLPRRLSEKEVTVASEDFDSWKTYLTHGHGWWFAYLNSVVQFGDETGCEELEMPFYSYQYGAPLCQDMSVIENVTKYAMDGNEERLFSVLEKHPDQDLKDLALASAAFGLPVVRRIIDDELDRAFFEMQYAKEEWRLGSRKEIVRRLFTDGASGNSNFVDVGFKLAMKEELQVEPELLRLLTWGTLRRWLLPSLSTAKSNPFSSFFGFQMALQQAKLGHGIKGLPASVFQYAIDHPEFLDERSSEDRTLLMEASSLHSCAEPGKDDPPDNQPALARRLQEEDPCQLPYYTVKSMHEALGVSFTAMDEVGKNAAMVAAQHGALDRAKGLQSAMLEEEMKKQPWIYHFPFMLSFVLVLHMALALVTLLFDCCSGG
ncbi:DGA1 [Symbiodinium natans]|uniref:DGA1 protein n=1 Tax=Symbiodinium natans TaxID=878477 RepID=A0A812JTY9_9DINO|nr:DGA1 [Symbiodinium natans]